jgi:UDP-N-acetylglucosamine 2-epimerase
LYQRLSIENFRQLDIHAWDVITKWHLQAEFDPHYLGVDFTELVRFYLWDKVGRALRKTYAPAFFEFEKSAFDIKWCERSWPWVPRYGSELPLSEWPQVALRAILGKNRNSIGDLPIVFVPYPDNQLRSTINQLTDSYRVKLAVSQKFEANVKKALLVEPTRTLWRKNERFVKLLHKKLIDAMKAQGIEFLLSDIEILLKQLMYLATTVELQTKVIKSLKPNAILVHTDNHPPYQVAVAIASKLGIPSIMIQHGLDCEHFYLEAAYASTIAVWGPARKQRYLKDQSSSRKTIVVTGNPAFDKLNSVKDGSKSPIDWLWVTRPHTSSKCFSPSRHPLEGIWIMECICRALANAKHSPNLYLRTHPSDYQLEYLNVARNFGVFERVHLIDCPLEQAFELAEFVISEDSTAGLEAMLAGKILVHAHFAPCTTTVPFVEYGAALPGNTPEILLTSIAKAANLDKTSKSNLKAGQRKFIEEFAGDLDCNASGRLITLIEETAERDFNDKG